MTCEAKIHHCRYLRIVLVAWISFFVAIFFVDAASAQNLQGRALQPVSLQLGWKHQFQFAGYYAAKEKGFYKEAGLNVTFLEGGPEKSCIKIMISGESQYCADDGGNVFQFVNGAPIVAIAAILQSSPVILMTRKDSGLKMPHDLIGKRVEIKHGGELIPEIKALFQREGISLDKIVHKEDSFGIAKLLTNEADAIFVYASNEPELMDKAGVQYNLIRPRSYGIDFYGDSLFTSRQELKKFPERVKALRAASLKGWRYAMDNKEEIVDLIISKYKVASSKDHLLYEARVFESLMQSNLIEIGHMNPSRWRHMADILVGRGLASPGYSLKEFIYDPDFRPDYSRLISLLGAIAAFLLLGITALMLHNSRLSREVTERIRAEAELEEAKELAEMANREKTRFLTAVSHDLRQPIHAISLFSTALLNRLKEKEGLELVSKVRNSLSNLSGMLDGLLDMSRLENHAIVPHPIDFPVHELIDGIISANMSASEAKSLELRVVKSSNYMRPGLLGSKPFTPETAQK